MAEKMIDGRTEKAIRYLERIQDEDCYTEEAFEAIGLAIDALKGITWKICDDEMPDVSDHVMFSMFSDREVYTCRGDVLMLIYSRWKDRGEKIAWRRIPEVPWGSEGRKDDRDRI